MTACTTDLPVSAAVVCGARGLVVRSIRGRDRALARVLAWWLDAKLAAGEAPDGNWLRAVRASQLTTPVTRARLGTAWRRVLRWQRAAIRDAASNVQQLIEALEAPGPMPARGVAMAAILLTDRTGPLYRPQSPEHLAAAVAAVVRCLDSGAPLHAERPDSSTPSHTVRQHPTGDSPWRTRRTRSRSTGRPRPSTPSSPTG